MILDSVYACPLYRRPAHGGPAFQGIAVIMRRFASSHLLQSFQAHYADLLRFLARRLGDNQRAADVAQDTWLRLADQAPEAEVQDPRAYLFRVAGNLAIDNLRREGRLAELHVEETAANEVSDPGAGLERNLLAREALEQLDAALDQLPPKARQALLMNRLDGLTHAQIARRLGVSESMVGKYIVQAMRHCRDHLQQREAQP
ncbi:RNA polymerase sigma-70 factor, ECF subfamily [Pseudomonas citronellolis]|uniref:RNA polymerase sigma-70 factor, ECF subfamily n=2 Tax=Pseudomonas citronellolis TaxID=53408 RepID=A0AAQ1HNM0_9PSED|nr:RNA polymerase sigma-70 factor, ECF subfamily [Pseudomonas citronellolis]